MTMRRLSYRALSVAGAVLLLGPLGLGARVAFSNPLGGISCDFDDDGFEDLAIGVPGDDVGADVDAGAVNVIYGSGSGLRAAGNELWHQDTSGVEGGSEAGDAFGATVACGDFDVDGFDDLAVGVPREDVGTQPDAGAVNVLFGSGSGLETTDDQIWTQDTEGVKGGAESGDAFGSVLSVGQFDAGRMADLAIGVPQEDEDATLDVGGVHVLYGSVTGPTATADDYWSQTDEAVTGLGEADDDFGATLVSGDFDGDDFDDLAIGAPREDVGGAVNSGSVNILFGDTSGLTGSDDQIWSQDSDLVQGDAEENDSFALSLAAGDFDDDGFDDVAVGAPGEDLTAHGNAGAVNVLYGAGTGLTSSGDQVWSQEGDGVRGHPEKDDAFGFSLAAGDFDGDGFADIAIGDPGEDLGPGNFLFNAGQIHVLYGTGSGLDEAGDDVWQQDSNSVDGSVETGDTFGSSLVTADFNGDGQADVAVGVPGDSVGVTPSAGVTNVLYGTPPYGIAAAGDQEWSQASTSIRGAQEGYDRLAGAPASSGIYRIGYTDGTDVRISNDYHGHNPLGRIDIVGLPQGEQHTIVAAADGTIEVIVDSNVAPTTSNNYVWIAHSNGEWTKYSHFETGSVSALGHVPGDFVTAGTELGFEGEVGQADGEHLHWEVAVPTDPLNPIDGAGFVIGENRLPLICRIAGNVFIEDVTYSARAC
jgi:hypothetical protein